MSDPSAEDEILAAAANAGHVLARLADRHGKAASWMERRRIRKQISQTLRIQRKAHLIERKHQLANTESAVARLRVHALAVKARAEDPAVDADRRLRDKIGLRSHTADLQQLVLDSARLTVVEKGVGLDGIVTATAFPAHVPKARLFDGAHRVKGIEALRYRANIARTRTQLPTVQAELREERRRFTTAHYARPARDTATAPTAEVTRRRPARLADPLQRVVRTPIGTERSANTVQTVKARTPRDRRHQQVRGR